ncbi:hypothetical protein RQP46_007056 [Phenoliferia psychrophenolica]
MSGGWLSYLTGSGAKGGRDSTREAIVNLREHLLMLDKKEEHLNTKIENEQRKAKANATTNKRVALQALRQKKVYENELDSIAGRKLTLETQVNAIESANMNKETLQAIKKGSDVLKSIHGSLTVDKVDNVMDDVRTQLELTNEINDAISNPAAMGIDVDASELEDELAELEQEELNKRLAGAEAAPLHSPGASTAVQQLLDLLGFDALETIGELISHRGALALAHSQSISEQQQHQHQAPPHLHRHQPLPPQVVNPRAGAGYAPKAQVTFQSAEDLAEAKRARKQGRNAHKGKGRGGHDDDYDELDLEYMRRLRDEELARGPGALVSGNREAVIEEEKLPNVYLSQAAQSLGSLHFAGQKSAMPLGTTREDRGEYEEITIPAPRAVPPMTDELPIEIRSMDQWGQRTFHAYKSLNRLQSIVFPVAYSTNENMLVCAPTGAGKTDVALLTILRCLASLCTTPLTANSKPTLPPASTYKIIYVAPLKALAAEITLKFSKRLSWAGVRVRELTGDMKMTKKEVEETGVIVTTPEKWDVVTRKGAGTGDGEVAEKVKLLIIDEVHLLHEDRGAVIESIVARTLRQVESSQNVIRIVGLSATLPNYVDVADFLRVNRRKGLFYFDASFRPVPLEQHFLGVKGKPGSPASRAALDNAAFDKVAELLKAGHQVMVFVHARKDTVKTAQTMHEKAMAEGISDLLDPNDNERYHGFKRDMGSSRNREMKELAAQGFGIHHAGMLRSDRNITERMFEANVTKVLCCTATLAWGVNLPAYAVVIKGTQIYDSGKGSFVDLSILDVLQIFGRAGRPQYESQGVGYICTTSDKLDHYTQAITQQHPIESKFVEGLVDSLNAEISLGTVANVDEGSRWLSYSYLFVRMRKNPMLYGIPPDDVAQDPRLGARRRDLIIGSAKKLVQTRMVTYDEDLETLVPTDLGRIASRYYIRHASIEVFNELFQPVMNEARVLALISASVEFAQIAVRENEVPELKALIEGDLVPCMVKGGTDTSAGKVNTLLQAYISRAQIDDFALVSDTGYVSQNAARIVRALLDIAMSKRWAPVTLVLMEMSKAIEKRLWSFKNPLRQFDLQSDLIYSIEQWADEYTPADIIAMSAADFGALIHQNERLGAIAIAAARQLPSLGVAHSLQPVSHDLLRVRLDLERQFDWSEKRHGTAEAFWVWIEDSTHQTILQVARVVVRESTTKLVQQFVVPVGQTPSSLFVRIVSDRWLNDGEPHLIDLTHLVMPPEPPAPLALLDLPLLQVRDAFKEPRIRDTYHQYPALDPVQTQAFHTIYHTSNNALICAPSAPSRGTLLELAIWRTFSKEPNSRVLFLSPRKALSRSVGIRLRRTFAQSLGLEPTVISKTQDIEALPRQGKPFIAVTHPSILLKRLITHPKQLGTVDLIVAHDLHALDPAYELLLARLRWAHPTARVVGSSSSLQDATDVADWLGAPPMSTYAFAPSARSSALTTVYHPFAAPHSRALLRSMVKPAYDAMRRARSTLCIVPSRDQCLATALDLVTQTASNLEETFVARSLETIETYAETLSNPSLGEALARGIAVYHDGLKPDEQALALRLFDSGYVRVLIAPRDACWTLPVRASLVIVLGAQFVATSHRTDNHEREIQDYPLPDLLQIQSLAVPAPDTGAADCLVLCQREQAELYARFLLQGVPLESALAPNPVELDPLLLDTFFTDILADRIKDRQGVVDFLSWTYLARRVDSNPAYYGEPGSGQHGDQLARLADRLVATLEVRCAVLATGKTDFAPSLLGRLYGARGVGLDDVKRIQLLGLDRLVSLSRPSKDANVTTPLIPMEAKTVVTVSYARTERFDISYLALSHMKLCRAEWGSSLLGFSIASFAEGPFVGVTSMFFESKDAFEAAWKMEGTLKILSDVSNYTDAEPQIAVATPRTSMSRTLRVAAIQVGRVDRSTPRPVVVARLTSLLVSAAAQGVQLAVFPETTFSTFFPRYFIESDAELAAYFEKEPASGISDVQDADTRAFFAKAKELGVDVVIGYGEETPEGERYNTASYVSSKVGTCGKYRKIHLPGNLGFNAFRPPGLFPAGVKTPIVGMLICNDRRWAEGWRVLGLQGTEIVCIGYNTTAWAPLLWGIDPDSMTKEEAYTDAMFHHKLVCQAHAYTNATFLITSARCGVDDGLHPLISGSMIVSPEGHILAENKTEEDQIIWADIDLDACRQGKEKTFAFEKHRRIEHYGPIVERAGVIEPAEFSV